MTSFLAGRQIPSPDRVKTYGNEGLAIARDRDVPYFLAVPYQGWLFFAGQHIPTTDDLLIEVNRDVARIKRRSPVRKFDELQELARIRIEKLDAKISTLRKDCQSVVRQEQGWPEIYPTTSLKRPNQLTRLPIDDWHRPFMSAG